jgi:PucR family transcriptional regulator, purine catabolism regulatory protein
MLKLEHVMQMRAMRQAKLLNEPDVLDRKIEWVSVIEMPVEQFVRPHELVLTTAMGCGQDPDVVGSFVRDILDSEAAGLAIAIGRHVHNIPDKVLRLAEEEQFPLIEIPRDVRFSDVTEGLLYYLKSWQQAELEHNMEIQQRLLHLFMQNKDLSSVAEVVHQELVQPILIIDKRGIVKGKSVGSKALEQTWEDYIHWDSSPFIWEHTQPTDNQYHTEIRFLSYEGDVIGQLLIRSASEVHGFLLFLLPEGMSEEDFLTKDRTHFLEHVATISALWFLKETSIYETEMRLRGDFVWSLAKGELDSSENMLAQAKSFGYNVNVPYVCVLGYVENADDLYKKEDAGVPFEHWLQQLLRYIEEQVIDAGISLIQKTMTTFQRDEFVIFLEVPLDQVTSKVHAFLDKVEHRLRDVWPELIMSWGIGENSAGVRTFQSSFNDAQVALNLGRRQKGTGSRYTYADMDVYRALLPMTQNKEMKEITLSTIGPLIDYQKQRGIDLIGTLMAYIRHQGNVSSTARAMYLHRQSLIYRLRKIESLTSRSLHDPDDIFLLDLCTKLWVTGLEYDIRS